MGRKSLRAVVDDVAAAAHRNTKTFVHPNAVQGQSFVIGKVSDRAVIRKVRAYLIGQVPFDVQLIAHGKAVIRAGQHTFADASVWHERSGAELQFAVMPADDTLTVQVVGLVAGDNQLTVEVEYDTVSADWVPPAPTVTALSPSIGSSELTSVGITGTNFDSYPDGYRIWLHTPDGAVGTTGDVVVDSPEHITAMLPGSPFGIDVPPYTVPVSGKTASLQLRASDGFLSHVVATLPNAFSYPA